MSRNQTDNMVNRSGEDMAKNIMVPSDVMIRESNRFARGRLRQPGVMNKMEARYALELELRKRVGEIAWYAFEGVKLRLADKTFYTPDFAVMLASGELQIHEVKGHWEDDARVKIKVAAAMFPFRFIATDGKGYNEEF